MGWLRDDDGGGGNLLGNGLRAALRSADQRPDPFDAGELLDLPDRKPPVMEKHPEGLQEGDVLGAIEPAPAGALHGTDDREPRLPEPQDMRGDAHLVGGLGNGPEGVGALGHGLLREGAVDPRLHHLAGAETDNPPWLDGRGLAGLGIAAHAGPLGADLEDAEA